MPLSLVVNFRTTVITINFRCLRRQQVVTTQADGRQARPVQKTFRSLSHMHVLQSTLHVSPGWQPLSSGQIFPVHQAFPSLPHSQVLQSTSHFSPGRQVLSQGNTVHKTFRSASHMHVLQSTCQRSPGRQSAFNGFGASKTAASAMDIEAMARKVEKIRKVDFIVGCICNCNWWLH